MAASIILGLLIFGYAAFTLFKFFKKEQTGSLCALFLTGQLPNSLQYRFGQQAGHSKKSLIGFI